MFWYFVAIASVCILPLILASSSITAIVLSSAQRSRLTFSPNHLTISEITLIIVALSCKGIQRRLGLVPELQKNLASKDLSTAYDLPDVRLSMPLILKERDVAVYLRAASISSDATQDDASRIFFLTGLTTPLMLLLVAKRSCPILPLGSVNVRNRFEFLNPELCRMAASASLQEAGAEARLVRVGRRVKRGVEFDVIVQVAATKPHTSEVQVIFRQIITLLQFLPPHAAPSFVETETTKKLDSALEAQTRPFIAADDLLDLPNSAPGRWAAFSKDYNPIHVSAWAARAFGFPGKIAHGNLAVVRAMGLLGGTASSHFHDMWSDSSRPSWLEVEFKRPMVVPLKLEVHASAPDDTAAGASRFQLLRNAKVHVEGRAGWL